MGPIEKILAATDLTEASDLVLRAAGEVALAAGAELHVLHALDFETLPKPEDGERPTFQGRFHEAERTLDEQIRRSVPEGVRLASREVVMFVPHTAIVDRAAEVDSDLIVLGPRGRAQFGETLLGTTADRVIRTVSVPCLLVRGALELPLRRVLVPLDLSAPARDALEVAIGWARTLGPRDRDAVELVALHVAQAWKAAGVNSAGEDVRAGLDDAVANARAGAGDAPNVAVRVEIHEGDAPAADILRVAEAQDTGLLVAGTHGRGPIQRALIGSVASRIARDARRPVLLVPPGASRRRAGQASG